MSEPIMNESYQCGWNDAITDMAKGLILTCVDPLRGEDYEEGYMAGQDFAILRTVKYTPDKEIIE